MNTKNKTWTTHLVIRRSVAACLAAVVPLHSFAATLPTPAASPLPVSNYEYDAEGNATKQVKAPSVLNLTTSSSYNNLDQRTLTIDAKGGQVKLTYDGWGRLVKVVDPRSLATSYAFTGLGTQTKRISPDTGTSTFAYDSAGRLKTALDARAVKTTYNYDALSRLTSRVYSATGQTSETYTFQYDQAATNITNGIGRLTTQIYPSGRENYGYTPQGELSYHGIQFNALTGVHSQINKSVRYGYDAAGRIAKLTYPSGWTVNYNYSQGQIPVCQP